MLAINLTHFHFFQNFVESGKNQDNAFEDSDSDLEIVEEVLKPTKLQEQNSPSNFPLLKRKLEVPEMESSIKKSNSNSNSSNHAHSYFLQFKSPASTIPLQPPLHLLRAVPFISALLWILNSITFYHSIISYLFESAEIERSGQKLGLSLKGLISVRVW